MLPVDRLGCFILSFAYLTILIVLTGCQSPTAARGVESTNTWVFDVPKDSTRGTESSSIPQAFVRLLDLVHQQPLDATVESSLRQIANWPRSGHEAFDPENRRFIQTVSELLVEVLQRPSDTLAKLNHLSPQNHSQYLTKIVLQSYLYQWTDNCEKAISVLTTHEPQNELDARTWTDRIWAILDGPCAYRSFSVKIGKDLTLLGWWDLARIAIGSNTEHERELRYREWQSKYPLHIAKRFPPAVFRTQYSNPRRIALLLPQSGPLSSAADAIKNGLLSAHLETPSYERSTIEVYDTSTSEVTTLVRQAIDDGAEVIVGPLEKENVRRVLEKRAVRVPIVTLNRPAPGARLRPHRNVVHLAQIVEDDADAIARQVRRQNLHRVIVVRGLDQWCTRAALHFRNSIDSPVTIAAEGVLGDLSLATEAVANLLGVSQSTNRQSKLANTTQRVIKFTARRRHDVDAIIAFVDREEFSALSAALHYHFAGNLPVFLAEPTFRDISYVGNYADGVEFTDTPANLYDIPLTTKIHQSFVDASVLYPLYVFGIDAYRTAMQIEAVLSGQPVFGYTGYLRRNDQGMLLREPVWGRVYERRIQPRAQITDNERVGQKYLY